MGDTTLTGQQVLDAGLADWRLMVHALQTRFATRDFATGLALVQRIAAVAEEMNHHPDIDLRYAHVDVRLTSHDTGGVTGRDLELARRASEAAADLGVAADPGAVTALELALDSADHERVKPFWAALLGYGSSSDDELSDPGGGLPTLWFQGTDEHAEPRQRWHLDVWVPHDVAEGRIAAALAAGGTLVSDAAAPSFWVLADADGNKACICTWQDRSG
ncbi:4a-hydroxytetrahydrobiopterin dehydratase [Nocardioides guangzhouensis]|uniref:Putative pterin-4-alpha-carbinolamine dehydratase n=1 Tax=Nocardioides guangzhouensis TaxID=2497878 RepID=A0A4Q4ZKM4_9ACTN|nr:4a-hydroxytetrahydrobiopterin dehydratase [Nocardioides guangzhouensis]RYP88922.1 4a-hydroxytetrahydrobiopterin dehydratase [Nocardioides guangzhouensis]